VLPSYREADLSQIHTEGVFGSSLGQVWCQGQMSKVEVTRNTKRHFRPFRRPACVCLIKHLKPLVSTASVIDVQTAHQ